MTYSLSQLFLQSTQFYAIVLVSVIGLIFIDRRTFLRALTIMLLGMVVNVFLKSVFKVPLKSHLQKDWYAFPSGHAGTATTFYGYLIHRFKNPLLTLIGIVLIVGVCWALVYSNYHNWIDVIAAVGFSVILIIVFHWLDTSSLFKDNFMLLVLLVTVFAWGLGKLSPGVASHTAVPLGALVGVCVTAVLEKMFGYQGINPFVDFIIIILGIVGLNVLFAKLHLNGYNYKILEFSLISFWGTYSPHIFAKLRR